MGLTPITENLPAKERPITSSILLKAVDNDDRKPVLSNPFEACLRMSESLKGPWNLCPLKWVHLSPWTVIVIPIRLSTLNLLSRNKSSFCIARKINFLFRTTSF